ncbi:MAG: DNA polymerase III subunit gamma/tau [Chromatiales bacterium]|nr:MAG: DNA polymerase III subunit gamma/tau [Chromatiales bacterium]
MSYLVLARRWRPRQFADVIGKDHVVRAMQNALGADQVHHAYLFAGTRGVGKTTLARILAKALNCLEGVSPEPCGKCSACVAVDEGRFVDLIEVDAASRTGVDDTRELLDNVQYTPTSGRYKVYLVDEVHMLSRQSFNALLKTLEEPPPHVKFLFATTDPQKLPVTVLSRCLQFNLKRLPAALIEARLATICDTEGFQAEPAALVRLARAANGSVRDALSLLDQALAYGNNAVSDADVAAMLGSLGRDRVLELLHPVAAGDAAELLARIQALDEDVPDYEGVLDELATALQRLAVLQLAGSDALPDEDSLEAMQALAGQLEPEQVQLYYQIAITGRRDLALAPEPRLGFEMALLRMLAFQLDAPGDAADKPRQATAQRSTRRAAPKQAAAASAPTPTRSAGAGQDPEDWPAFVAALSVTGAARQLAEHTALESATPDELRLRVEPQNDHLVTDKLVSRLCESVRERLGSDMAVRVTVAIAPGRTLAGDHAKAEAAEDARARTAIEQDPEVRQIVDMFQGEVVPESVKRTPDGP